MSKSLLTVVIPAHQEAKTIRPALEGLLGVLDLHGVHGNLVVVLDGPDDEALDEIAAIGASNIAITVLPTNEGKGAALRAGCVGLTSEYTGFIDADLDIDPISLINCLNMLTQSTNPKIVCAYGSKFHHASCVTYPILRRFGSRAFRWIVRILFGFNCYDTQTGVKVFRTRYLVDAVKLTKERRFIFDVELFWILSKMGWDFADAPVVLNYRYSTTISLVSIVQMLVDLLRLRLSKLRTI